MKDKTIFSSKKTTKKTPKTVKKREKTRFVSNSRPPAHKGPWVVFLTGLGLSSAATPAGTPIGIGSAVLGHFEREPYRVSKGKYV